ncbi:MAG: hypothetical protein H6574_04715 [Lewinellaceae bacterium]|nr:hypothetical protein [Saprospiraceae bacterium]MCB9330365.1 hypothetical protein [Lewinellaceae bacterium]
MNEQATTKIFWRLAFFSLLIFYCFFYAPFGINETDGGFLTGLAWQILCGKTLYADVVYVRPPMSVWLRVLELKVLPETWAVLGERWLFYGKVATYSWLAAAVLIRERTASRWMLGTLGFVVSAHCYPATSWHTVDGILFSMLGIWFWTNFSNRWTAVLSGVAIIGALLCKQSFYPMLAVWLVFTSTDWPKQPQRVMLAVGAMLGAVIAFVLYLKINNLLYAYWELTSGVTSGNTAIEYGFSSFFNIKPALLLASIAMALFVAGSIRLKHNFKLGFLTWVVWLLLLIGTYAWTIWQRQDFTVPFAQTRLLFIVAAGFGAYPFWKKQWIAGKLLHYFALLALTWCASISWGYNLPILFATPWLFAVMEISNGLFKADYPDRKPSAWLSVFALLALLLVFRLGYSFVYRDGRRFTLTEHLGEVFPRLNGIFSSPETFARYQNLRTLASRYGTTFKTLPTFPEANYITATYPPLPLDWVVEREMGEGKNMVQSVVQEETHIYFVETDQLPRIEQESEYQLAKIILRNGRVLEKTNWFWVVVY